MLKPLYLTFVQSGSKLVENLAIFLWNFTLMSAMLPTAFVLAAGGNAVIVKMAKEKQEAARKTLAEAVVIITCLAWRFATMVCCWIQIRADGLETFRSEFGSSGRPCVMLSNHVSFMDVILNVVLSPLSQVGKVRMLVSGHVFKMPAIGTIVKGMGHFKVPFKASDTNSKDFTVDKEALAIQMKLLDAHLKAGGNAAWFPEGAINTGDPHKVQMFRAGGFAPAVQNDVELWVLTSVGNSYFWPKKASVGGRPCRIGYKIFKICDSTEAFLADVKAGDDGDALRAKTMWMANHLQQKVQDTVDELLAEGYSGTPPVKKLR